VKLKSSLGFLLVSWTLAGCDGDSSGPSQDCGAATLPWGASALAPRITDIALEAQPSGIIVLVTATDTEPAGLAGVQQSLGVYRDAACTTTPIIVVDDLAGSGVEESFGTAVDAATDATLYATISAAAQWPVVVDFSDADGNRTTGRVMARVIN
jgi:hypothetical protein